MGDPQNVQSNTGIYMVQPKEYKLKDLVILSPYMAKDAEYDRAIMDLVKAGKGREAGKLQSKAGAAVAYLIQNRQALLGK